MIIFIDFLEKLIISFIGFLDGFEKTDTKLIHSFNLSGIKVETDTGFKPVSHIHMTKKFNIYKIFLDNGMFLECADTHILFDKNMNEVFVKDLSIGDFIQTKEGIKKIVKKEKLNNKICMCDITVDDENHRYYTNGILSHNTTTSALFMLHYILFNVDKNALVLGNKRKTAVEILDKAKKIFIELPYFLRPGVYKWNEGEIVLDNGCRLMAEATTINSGISFTFHCVLADEFAHIAPNIMEKFYNNLFPTITAGKARFMITSTQNGYNLFYRLCKSAEARENEYGFFKTDWDEVPEWNPEKKCWEKRDEEWHRIQVSNYGSEEAFNKQFGTSFDVNSNTLIDPKILKRFERSAKEFVQREMPGVMYAEYFRWDPDYDISQMKNDFFVITTDIAEGVSGDDTVYLFNKLCFNKEEHKVFTRCIGYFKYNKVNAETATLILKQICQWYLDINKYIISLEYNLYGELFAKYILENIEKDPQHVNLFNEDVLMKYWNEEMTRFTFGKKITPKSKQYGVALFKQFYEKEEVVNESIQFVSQVSNFCDFKGNGTYAASFGHDDLVMAELQMVFVKENPRYKSLCETFLATIDAVENNNEYNPYESTYSDISNPNEMYQPGQDLYSGMQQFNTMQDLYDFQNSKMMYIDPSISWEEIERNNNLERLRHM